MKIEKDIILFIGITISLSALMATVVVISHPLNLSLKDKIFIVMSLCVLSGLSLRITSRYTNCDYGEVIIASETSRDEVPENESVLAAQDNKKGVQFKHSVEVITITPNRSTSVSIEIDDARMEGDMSMESGINNEEPKMSYPLEFINMQRTDCNVAMVSTTIKQPKLALPRYYEALK